MSAYTDRARRAAVELCAAVRAWDRAAVAAVFDRGVPAPDLCVVLAAMVPEGAKSADLLAWVDQKGSDVLRADAPALAGVGLLLSAAVRNRDRGRVSSVLAGRDHTALAVVLAAMVPDDVPVDELLAWVDRPRPGDSHGPVAA